MNGRKRPGPAEAKTAIQSLGSRYQLRHPPQLTQDIASRHWRELNRMIQSFIALAQRIRGKEPLQHILRSFCSVLSARKGLMFICERNTLTLRCVLTVGFSRPIAGRVAIPNQMAVSAFEEGKPILINRAEAPEAESEFMVLDAESCLSIPIQQDGIPWGVLQVIRERAYGEGEAILAWLQALVVESMLGAENISTGTEKNGQESVVPSCPLDYSMFRSLVEAELFRGRWKSQLCSVAKIGWRRGSAKETSDDESLREARFLKVIRRTLRTTDIMALDPEGNVLLMLPSRGVPETEELVRRIKRNLVQAMGGVDRPERLQLVFACSPLDGTESRKLFHELNARFNLGRPEEPQLDELEICH